MKEKRENRYALADAVSAVFRHPRLDTHAGLLVRDQNLGTAELGRRVRLLTLARALPRLIRQRDDEIGFLRREAAAANVLTCTSKSPSSVPDPPQALKFEADSLDSNQVPLPLYVWNCSGLSALYAVEFANG